MDFLYLAIFLTCHTDDVAEVFVEVILSVADEFIFRERHLRHSVKCQGIYIIIFVVQPEKIPTIVVLLHIIWMYGLVEVGALIILPDFQTDTIMAV